MDFSFQDEKYTEEEIVGGYDLFFLEEPPSDVVCPICRLVARDPYQVSCCGKIYCKSCFGELEERSKWQFRCANCREDEPQTFPDRKTKGQINSLRVACSKREDGCNWRGALREMEQHLKTCEFADVDCPFSSIGCGFRPLRKDIEEHEELNLRNHLSLAMQRISQLEDSMKSDKESQAKWLNSAMADVKSVLQVHKKEVKRQFDRRLDVHQEEMQSQLDMIKHEIMSEFRSLPLVFKLPDFSDLQDDDDDWHSPAFYSHQGGYKMCLRVYTNGCTDVRGTHLSCYVYLMRGDYDDGLEWPFRGTIHIQILNQLKDDQHHSEKITFSSRETKNFNSRVLPDRSMGVTGLGKSKFISQFELGYKATLGRQYLKDDTLYFRVSKVDVSSSNSKKWLHCVEEDAVSTD